MKTRSIAAALATAALALTAVAADGEPAEPYLVDQAGDANGINGQGVDDTVPEAAVGGYDMADLLALRFVTLFDEATGEANALQVRLQTGAPLSTMGDNLLIRMNGDVGGCPGRLQIRVDNVAYGDEISFSWYLDGCIGQSDDAVISGITITDEAWVVEVDDKTSEAVITIPFDTLAAHGVDKYLKAGKLIMIEDVNVRHVNAEPTGVAPYSIVVPVLDIMRNEDFATYRIEGGDKA